MFDMVEPYLYGSLGGAKLIAGQDIDILDNMSKLVIQFCQSRGL